MTQAIPNAGGLLREWRQRRRLSQLGLAAEAEISQRHLSFVESGRSTPSRDMVLRLAEHLTIPLRARNAILVAAGFAPVYRERALDDPGLEAARHAIDVILTGHEPHPALAMDRHWTLVTANRSVAPLLAGIDEALLQPPANVLRLSLHPGGLAPRIRNFREWRAHVLGRVAQQIDNSADPVLMELLEELKSYPVPPGSKPYQPGEQAALGGIAVPIELATDDGTLSFVSTTTVFGTAVDISLSELAIETFFPTNAHTAEMMRRLGEAAREQGDGGI
ncbi:MAG: helix-turn-helix transcriptional regulator [Gammaproteobacteria bacterium]|nr:helix-turn-helix transcriptional regulator [Gammaproteobacteria bacterium]